MKILKKKKIVQKNQNQKNNYYQVKTYKIINTEK